VRLRDIAIDPPPPGPADWNADGVVILPGFMPDELIDDYRNEWLTHHAGTEGQGWPHATPYMDHLALRALGCYGPLNAQIEQLIGEPAGMHLNLTGWVSTERDWHQDSYLNPAHVGDHYAAVWIALGDIDARSGPFQYVPGSHRWPQVTRDAIAKFVDIADPMWPKRSEEVLSPMFEAEIVERDAQVVSYVPQRGDVLIWHGRLLHRGSRAQVQGMTRPAVIIHYSGIEHRPDMPEAVQHALGGWYMPILSKQPVR
jgi:hypothetical protein